MCADGDVHETPCRPFAAHEVTQKPGAGRDPHRHDNLPLFGIGRERSDTFWRGVLRQLIARGALRVKSGEYASLELVTDEARPVMTACTTVQDPNPSIWCGSVAAARRERNVDGVQP